VIGDLGLKAVGSVWHKFAGEGGVTGLIALTESHLACHTYPEHRTATFNLYCCRTRPEWNWESNLKTILGAEKVSVSKIERGESTANSEIPNLKFEISNLKSGNGRANEISNLKSAISKLRNEDESAAPQNQDPQFKIQNPKSKMAKGGDA
jgi:hypothetical protein